MKDSLVDFLQNLSKDPALKARYKADPAGVAKECGVSSEDVDLLLSKDQDALNKRFAANDLSANEIQTHHDFD